MDYRGTLILRERLRKNWSQEGLCRGICAVSYLSKIEKGRAEPSEDILRRLLERLGLHTDRALEEKAAALAALAWECTGCWAGISSLFIPLPQDWICSFWPASVQTKDCRWTASWKAV